MQGLLGPLNDPGSAACVTAESAMLAALDGSYRTPIVGLAEVDGDRLTPEGLLLTPEGSDEIRASAAGGIGDAQALGTELGCELRRRAGPGFGSTGDRSLRPRTVAVNVVGRAGEARAVLRR